MKLKEIIKNVRIRLSCDKSKHSWNYCTWGSAFVDNLNDTFGIWEIATRTCNTCGKHEFKLKNGWEKAKTGLTIKDLQ